MTRIINISGAIRLFPTVRSIRQSQLIDSKEMFSNVLTLIPLLTEPVFQGIPIAFAGAIGIPHGLCRLRVLRCSNTIGLKNEPPPGFELGVKDFRAFALTSLATGAQRAVLQNCLPRPD